MYMFVHGAFLRADLACGHAGAGELQGGAGARGMGGCINIIITLITFLNAVLFLQRNEMS